MTIRNLIIHNLEKEIQGAAKLFTSKDVLSPSDKKTISLTEELNSRYRDNIEYGVFIENSDDAETFQKEFDKYLANQKKANFINLSSKTINMLYNRINPIKQAKGGYLVYVDYLDKYSNHFFSVFLIRDKTDKRFKSKDGIIKIDEVICVETDKLAMACRINIKKYQDKTDGVDKNYLGFVSIKQPDTSNYFLEWIGAVKKERETENTNNLVKILNNITVPDEDGKPMSKENFQKKAYDVIRSFGKSPVNINTISSTLFGNATTLSDYAEKHNILLSTEFVPVKNIYRSLINYHFSVDGFDIKFPTDYYGDKIKIHDSDQKIVIINSEKLATAIKNEITKWKM